MSSELVAVELQLKGYEGVMSDMRALDQMLNGFRGKKNKIEIQADLANTKKELLALKGALTEFQEQQTQVSKGGTAWYILQGYIEETNSKMKDCRQRVNELQYALKQFLNMSWGQMFSKISSVVAHWGSAMQSAGNALTRLTTPFARFTSGMVMGAGYKAISKFTEGLESGFGRADTMRKYTRLMAEYETANYTAEQSRKDLDKSVQGLPIALDDAVSLAQRYTLSLGDMERGTKLAIATNNAFLASMSTENQRYQGMLQMQDLLNGKDLNSREWMSLGASMGKAINEIGLKLGYGKDELGEFRQELYAGHIATEDFLNALEAVGTGEGSLVKLAQESANTWEAFFSRISTASSRMVYGILTSMDELVNTASGGKFTTLNALFDDYLIGNIDKMTKSIQGWIKAHPNEIIEFGKALKGIRWGSIIKGFGQGIQEIAKAITTFSNAFGGADLSWIGRWMVRGNILGNFLTIFGGLIKGSRGIIGAIGATGFKGVQTIKNIKKLGGIAGWLGSLAVGDNPEKAEEAIETVAKSSGNMGKFSTGLSKIFTGWGQVATMIVGSAATAWGSMKLIKGAVKSFKETVDILGEVDWNKGAELLIGMGTFFTAMGGLSALAGGNVGASVEMLIGEVIIGAFTTLATGFAAIDMKLVKSTVKDLNKTVGYLKSAINGLNELGEVADAKSSLDKAAKAVEIFNDIRDVFKGKYDHFSGEMTSGLKGFGKGTTKSVENIAKTIGNLKTAIQTLNEFAKMDIDSTGVEEVAPKMQEALSALRTTILAIPSEWKDSGVVNATTNLSSSLGNVKKAFQSIVGKNGILGMIPKLVSQVNGADQSGVLLDLPNKMKKLGNALKEAYNALNSGIGNGNYMATNLDNFRQALKSAKFAVKHLQELGGMEVGDGVVSNIKNIFSKIKEAFNVDSINGIKEPIDTFVQTIRDALKAFEDFNTEIEINPTVKVGSGFDSSVTKAVGKINKGKGKIDSAVNSIPSSYYKSVRIHVAVSAIVSGIDAVVRTANQGAQTVISRIKSNIHTNGGATGGQFSRSGVLYRSGGGSVFKPRGIDTIPAMLAEGEYVHKKQAVDFFGVDFMRKVNNMDVRGAMESLLTKAGTSIGVGRQSIVNNTVNNNQRITQNINTNNPNFARARMGRFVGAL